jgi:Arc/MetJ-type ribon-helix-helix transcriptional regulator
MGEGKTPISARIDDDLVSWMDEQVEKKRFSSRSHALQYAVYLLKQTENTKLASEA